MRRTVVFVCLLALGLVGAAPGVLAAPAGPHGNGVMEPRSDGCPWPDELNPFLEAWGVEKCLPGQIPWTQVVLFGTDESGIRIVTDPLTGSQGSGWVTFWCQFRPGLKYQIGVNGLEPHTTYPVRAVGYGFGLDFSLLGETDVILGTLRTDARGRGLLNGVLRLEPGLYELDIEVGGLSVPDDDLVGLLVLR